MNDNMQRVPDLDDKPQKPQESQEQSGRYERELQLQIEEQDAGDRGSDPSDDNDHNNRNIMYLNIGSEFGVYDATKLDKPISIPVICGSVEPLITDVKFAGYGSFSYDLPEGWGGRNGDMYVSTGAMDRTTAFVEPNNVYSMRSAFITAQPKYEVLELDRKASVALGDYIGNNYPLKMTVDIDFPKHNSFYDGDRADRVHYSTLKACMTDMLGLRDHIRDYVDESVLMPGGPDQYLLPCRRDMGNLLDVSLMYLEQNSESHYDGFVNDEFDEFFDENTMPSVCADYTHDVLGVHSIEFDKNNPNRAVFIIDDAHKFNAGLLSSMMTGSTVNFEIEDSKGVMLQRGSISAENGVTNIGPHKSEDNYDKDRSKFKDASENNSSLHKLYALRNSVDNENRVIRSDFRSGSDFNASITNTTINNKDDGFEKHNGSAFNKLKAMHDKYDNIKTKDDKTEPDYNNS